jgi:Flp pilus assembly protein protease CpaA
MKKIFLLLIAMMLCSATSSAQTTVLNEDFEGDLSSWVTNSRGSQTNQWWAGTAAAYSGANAAYISNYDASVYNYDINSTSTVHLWTDVYLPANTYGYILSFDWKANGESGYDYLSVFLTDTNIIPPAGYELNNYYYTPLGTYNGYTTWQQATIVLPVSATTNRLVFSWHNDGSDGAQPPAAIDNIVIMAITPVSSTIHLTTAGTLENQPNIINTNHLTLTGNIDARDIRFMRDNMPLLSELNISGANIVAYSGLYGTDYGNYTSYPANEMPIYSFNNTPINTRLTSVQLPTSITSIGDNAFYNCSGLTSLTIPNSVITIGDNAFYYCSGLTSLIIPNSVTTIGDNAFSYCSDLTSITIGNSVTNIGKYAFVFNSNLTTVYFNATNCITAGYDGYSIYPIFGDCPLFTNLIIGNNVQTIPELAFVFTPLTSITIPNSVTTIGIMAFAACDKLTSVTIGNAVTTIGDGAFYGCSSLTTLTIPYSVTSIGERAFENCSGLTAIYVKAQNPPTLGSSVFSNVGNIPVHVPCNRANTYRNAYGWSYFYNFVEDIPFEITLQSNNPTMGVANIVQANTCTDNTAIIAAVPKTGYRFVEWNDGITISPRTIIVTQNITYTARFEALKYKVEVLPNDYNRGTTTGSGEYDANTTVSIRAIPYTGYYFARWSDGDTQNPRTITVTQDITYIAILEEGNAIADIETSTINIYPNPARDNITVVLPENVHQAVFTLYDMQGKMLIKKDINNQDAIQVSNLAAGVYIYNVRTEKHNYTGKLIME